MKQNQEFTASVAPMMDWTDRHCRWFHRQLSKHVELYTEMVVADAVIHGPRERLLGFNDIEHPVILQIGGSNPSKLAEAAIIGEGFGYDGVNINIGCPSDRVQSGRFGACLMAEPELVGDCFQAMQKAVSIPVTVKCRLGIDDQVVEDTLPDFLKIVSDAGCETFIIHARKAWLKGLSPKENREVPPLDYNLVRDMKSAFPKLKIELNGGLPDISVAKQESVGLDGFMLGRSAYHTPWVLTEIDSRVYDDSEYSVTRNDIALRLVEYLESVETEDRTAKALLRHIMGLYSGQVGARVWRRTLSEKAVSDALPSMVVKMALQAREEAIETMERSVA
ncbi:tRNA-U16,U17-dihydrouridine synthase [Litorimonas taeanensis]|uniref:tRNA-dihydrouridine(20/20a) synthase n=1 Tax=Litorimonas taeanensis TaxID=568099 RepID=A0A420WJL3_9PROT|nr:tRNA dihydrouridine(20/20a) synthase DusA [Litorimonas taeanensis]RKQ71213.1 tRNA-U16,U17-dihydrouridine synthase [Litorimonas taeanensis]